jgi:hypothetical protein
LWFIGDPAYFGARPRSDRAVAVIERLDRLFGFTSSLLDGTPSPVVTCQGLAVFPWCNSASVGAV